MQYIRCQSNYKWWSIKSYDGISNTNKPALQCSIVYENLIPISRGWSIKNPFTSQIEEFWTCNLQKSTSAKKLHDCLLSWQLYSSKHTHQKLVDSLLENTLLEPLKYKNAKTYGELWASLVPVDSDGKHLYPLGGKLEIKKGEIHLS